MVEPAMQVMYGHVHLHGGTELKQRASARTSLKASQPLHSQQCYNCMTCRSLVKTPSGRLTPSSPVGLAEHLISVPVLRYQRRS